MYLSSQPPSHLCSYLSIKDKAVLPKGRNKREILVKRYINEKKNSFIGACAERNV
jgi:hypothetical protein